MNISNSDELSLNLQNKSNTLCIACAFDFGVSFAGVDNKLFGVCLITFFFCLICSPCILMSCLYLCQKTNPIRKARSNQYENVLND